MEEARRTNLSLEDAQKVYMCPDRMRIAKKGHHREESKNPTETRKRPKVYGLNAAPTCGYVQQVICRGEYAGCQLYVVDHANP